MITPKNQERFFTPSDEDFSILVNEPGYEIPDHLYSPEELAATYLKLRNEFELIPSYVNRPASAKDYEL